MVTYTGVVSSFMKDSDFFFFFWSFYSIILAFTFTVPKWLPQLQTSHPHSKKEKFKTGLYIYPFYFQETFASMSLVKPVTPKCKGC